MTAELRRTGRRINRKRVQRLMRLMGLEALGPKPKTSRPAAQYRIYPYLLRGMTIDRPNQVWAADITYIPMARGFLYLVVVMDWYSRYVLAWRLSNTMDTAFWLAALEDALSRGRPEIFNTDQGAQLPSRPGEFHPEPLTDPDVILSYHPARATERRPPPSVEKRGLFLLPVGPRSQRR